MNEQRLQDYYQLIQTLLSCPSGEKPEILAANTELLDAGFLRVLEPAVEYYSQQGDNNTASFLRDLVTQLSAALNSPPEDIETYEQFLQDVLQATAQSNGNAQVIYPLLAANTDKLNQIFAEQLRRWATNTLAKADRVEYSAAVIVIFSNLIQQFPLGSKASNMEIAIAGYEIGLSVYTPSAFPENWAGMQNNLGEAYRKRILGQRAENIELAIAAYSAALEVYTRSAFPQQWAMAQNNLGIAYGDRILGNRAENIELAIAAFSAALKVRTRSAFPQDWAMTQNNLGIAYRNRILGERANNLELAIAAYSAALEVYTRNNTFPENWALVQNNLGIAYVDRILGERADNLELAIVAYSAALKVYTRNAFPENWAMTQNNLGIAYRNRILGERANNLELAIAAFSAALKVYTRNAFPENWATTQNNLGNAYSNRILGESTENIEMAIAAFSAALEVYTRKAFPENWAGTQNNLGEAYMNRILAEKAENIELAIAAYTAALEVYTRTAFPVDWAMTQNNLGIAYRNRILGEPAENLELAIAAYTAALEVYTKSAFPVDWAGTQNNLGVAYGERILGEPAENLELAIAADTAALEVYTRTTFPKDWAMTQINLGNAYSYRIVGKRAENLELAIAAYTAALEVYTDSTFPKDWAATQNNLGVAYRKRILGEPSENLELEIAAFSAALEVYTRSAFPQSHAETLLNLGISYQNKKQFDSAYKSFADAITTVESLRGEIISGDESKRKQAEEWNQLYRRMVEVCLELGKLTEAIEYVERSKTRNLVELILERDFTSIFPQEVLTKLEQLRDQIASGQYQLQNSKAKNPTALTQHLQQLRQQRQELQDSHLPVGSGFKFDQFQETLDKDTVIIEWYISTDTILTFVIKPNGQKVTFWQSQSEDKEALFDWVNEYLLDYYNQQDQWQNQLEKRLQKLAEILHFEEILAQLPKHCDRLIFIPHRFLHLFPLHALPVKESYLIDLFPNGVGYAPSCQLLQQVQLRQRPDFQSFFAIQNPTEDLYQDYEKDLGAVAAIKKQFANAHILKQNKAKKSAIIHFDEQANNVTINEELLKANCAFFFCHGYFNPDFPLDSGLELADDNLILADIITHFKLEHCRLVTLSACETGVTDSKNTSDEYIGLPSGFLLAGSTNVVSSLWTVDATATALLMIKFYEELQQKNNIILALNTAQRWLRNTSAQEFRAWLRKSNLDEDWQDELSEQFLKIEQQQGSTTKIFESPFYWSAFCAIGKGV
ncbi:MAG: CHAT domain-containing protein [Nostoc sp. ChiSLP01]|nr:CHAT domain-containing tetratricopeptide repeat protein [Nostoc sp. CmiSLP01]